MDVEIQSVEWGMFLGQTLPDRVMSSIREIEKGTGTIPVHQIKVGNRKVFQVLQQEWYVQKSMLFISEEITPITLGFAIQSWLHEIDLHRTQRMNA